MPSESLSIVSLTHPTTSPLLSNVDVIVGPLVVGVIFNAFLYGICLLQFTRYWMYQVNDKLLIKCLVAWTFLLDTFHTCALIYMLWVYVVKHFNDTAFLTNILWPFSATPIVTTLTSFPIQVYLSWRIRRFSGSIRVFGGLFVLSAAQASLGIACSLLAFQIPVVTSYHQLIPIVDAWQVLAVLADGSITVLLWWQLSISRTGARNSDNVITRVIRSSIETAAFGAFFCIMDLITFTTLQDTNFHVIFAFPMGRIYTNTLLLTLNCRKSLREELEQPALPDLLLAGSFGQFHQPYENNEQQLSARDCRSRTAIAFSINRLSNHRAGAIDFYGVDSTGPRPRMQHASGSERDGDDDSLAELPVTAHTVGAMFTSQPEVMLPDGETKYAD